MLEQKLMLQGVVGELEAKWLKSEKSSSEYLAILGHPHSLYGGTMENKVVTTMARAFRELNIPSLRINFRGVGNSGGQYDHGIGESDDLLKIIKQLKEEDPKLKIILAGFSFGSYVTYRVACQIDSELLISIAPSVENYNYTEFLNVPKPWLIVVPLKDEVVNSQATLALAQQLAPPPIIDTFEDCSHFFHGRLVELKENLIAQIKKQLKL